MAPRNVRRTGGIGGKLTPWSARTGAATPQTPTRVVSTSLQMVLLFHHFFPSSILPSCRSRFFATFLATIFATRFFSQPMFPPTAKTQADQLHSKTPPLTPQPQGADHPAAPNAVRRENSGP